MNPGKILVSKIDASYVIKLVGDVRVTLCCSLNNYMEAIFQSEQAAEVVIDMLDTKGVDSTTLGLLAKLALYCKESFNLVPIVFCTNDSLYKTLTIMGLDEVFEIVQSTPDIQTNYEVLSVAPPDTDSMKEHVLEAHRLLSTLNKKNKQEFMNLISTLEGNS